MSFFDIIGLSICFLVLVSAPSIIEMHHIYMFTHGKVAMERQPLCSRCRGLVQRLVVIRRQPILLPKHFPDLLVKIRVYALGLVEYVIFLFRLGFGLRRRYAALVRQDLVAAEGKELIHAG